MTHSELMAKYPEKRFGRVNVRRSFRTVDYKPANLGEWLVEDLGWVIELDHQCDEWEVGTVDEAMDFVGELNLVIDYCQMNK